MEMFNLAGKVGVITGGNGGIGLAMARGLGVCGAAIMIAARDPEKSKAALEELRAAGVTASFVSADITSKADCERLVAEKEASLGRLDILVNNAGIMLRGQPQDITEDDWRRVLGTNLTGAFLCCQAAYPAMNRTGGGKIINLGSMASLFGSPLLTAYASSKGGIVQQGIGDGVGQGQHPGQCRAAGFYPSSVPWDSGTYRTTNPCGPMGSGGGFGRDRSIFSCSGVKFHHGYCDCG